MTSATSVIGIAFRRPRGGVGRVLGPGDGAENILMDDERLTGQDRISLLE